jgi:uncharacterized protein (TIGR02001 family)
MSLRGWLPRVAGCLGASFLVVPAGAADLTGYIVLTTDYVFRGVSYSDGHGALQAGADVALDSGLYFGIWGSSVDLSNGPARQRDLEIDYYLGYSHELRRDWIIGINVVAYTFPGTEGDVDYDYVEYSITANYNDRAWFEYSYSPDLFHSTRHTHNVELFTEWPLPANLRLGAGAGYYDVSALTGSGYGYWQLGITHPFGIIDVDLRYHDTSRAVPIISTTEHARQRLVLSAKFPF